MKLIPFTYTIIRYVHDPAAGEALNIGVVACAPDVPDVRFKLEHRYERLSHAFSGFDGEQYRRMLMRLIQGIRQLQRSWSNAPLLKERSISSNAIVDQLWPDRGLSFTTGPTLSGVTDDLEVETSIIFERMIESQYNGHADNPKRTDEQVWRVYQRVLPSRALRALGPRAFSTPDAEYKFEHAFKNDAWHVVQPLSFDYEQAESLQYKATRWLGTTMALKDAQELRKIHFLLGKPKHGRHQQAYIKAKNLLHKSPLKHELVDEDDASAFASSLDELIRLHGVDDPET